MKTPQPENWYETCPWTLILCGLMVLLNVGLFTPASAAAREVLSWLQYDYQAILAGQLWRLVTGNLVHWSPEHFFLDVGAFLVVGWLYEDHFGRAYPWLLLGSALAVGLGNLVFLPQVQVYRGLSGVDSGQFAGALMVEFSLARRQAQRWLWLAPAALVFVAKIMYECLSGQMFFGTESLGDIGLPTPLAHGAGALGAVIGSFSCPWVCKLQGNQPPGSLCP